MISYAQNGEDVILNRVFDGKTRGFYIDVGAWDPSKDSVTKWFYDQGWSGINIEPVKEYYDKLACERPRDVNLNLALGKEPGTTSLNEWVGTGLSTVGEERFDVVAAANAGYQRRVVSVPTSTLAEIAKEYVSGTVDFLKVDVEGSERQVLEGGDWVNCRPRILVIEATEPMFALDGSGMGRPCWHEWENLVLDAGYVFGLFDGLNRFYYRQEEPELARLLDSPVNFLDGFTTDEAHRANLEITQLRARCDQLRQEASQLRQKVDQLRQEVDQVRQQLCQEVDRSRQEGDQLRWTVARRDAKIQSLRAKQFFGLRGFYMRLKKQL
jgi:FkbM family methyltransferase